MSITKRMRFEVLRRDSSTCRYCGQSAPDVKLHVDHVRPAALGGDDSAEKSLWPYFCGVCWNSIREIENRARQIMREESDEDGTHQVDQA